MDNGTSSNSTMIQINTALVVTDPDSISRIAIAPPGNLLECLHCEQGDVAGGQITDALVANCGRHPMYTSDVMAGAKPRSGIPSSVKNGERRCAARGILHADPTSPS